MKRPRQSGASLHSAGLVASVVALAFAAACSSKSDSPTTPSPTPGTNTPVFYTAVGASDAAGVGSSAACVPFTPCPNGMGYVPVIVRKLEAQGITVTLSNLGIPAAVIGPDFETLGQQYGRLIPGNFIEQEAPFVPQNTTVVSIFAGGNDTTTVVTAIGGGAGGSDPSAFIEQQITAFGKDYAALLSAIRGRAPGARIVVGNLPNLGAAPFAAGYPADRRLALQRVSVGFSTRVINPLTGQGIAVVDLLCDSRFASTSVFSSDGFHPNDTGYAIMADAFLAAMQTSNYPAPSSSCPQMTLIR